MLKGIIYFNMECIIAKKKSNPGLPDMEVRRRARQMNLSRVIRPVESAKRRVISFSKLSLIRKPKGAQDQNFHVYE